MALYKEMTNPENGAISNYHRIGSVTVENEILNCVLISYASREYRENENGRGIEVQNLRFHISIEEEESMGVRQLAYKKIKTLSDWEDAEDC